MRRIMISYHRYIYNFTALYLLFLKCDYADIIMRNYNFAVSSFFDCYYFVRYLISICTHY